MTGSGDYLLMSAGEDFGPAFVNNALGIANKLSNSCENLVIDRKPTAEFSGLVERGLLLAGFRWGEHIRAL